MWPTIWEPGYQGLFIGPSDQVCQLKIWNVRTVNMSLMMIECLHSGLKEMILMVEFKAFDIFCF